MAKAGVPKEKKKTRAKPKLTDKEQSERFIKAARELGVEAESGRRFEQAFTAILTNRGKKSPVMK